MTRFPALAVMALLSLTLLSACAEKMEDANGRPYDPYEDFNRDVYSFNTKADIAVFRPVAVAYRDDVPSPVRTGVHNFLQNLNTPGIFANEVLQGDFTDAGISLGRLVINTTLGFGGVGDAGVHAGLDPQNTGFGHTLAVYGVGHGPYLVLPLVGPSTPREAVGYAADASTDPIDYFIPFIATVGEGALGLVDQRAQYIDQIDDLRRSSIDEYATVRSVYLQALEASDREQPGSGGGTADIPDYTDPATGTTK
jgi:phospholipid-binding lipoprotein MlaA